MLRVTAIPEQQLISAAFVVLLILAPLSPALSMLFILTDLLSNDREKAEATI